LRTRRLNINHIVLLLSLPHSQKSYTKNTKNKKKKKKIKNQKEDNLFVVFLSAVVPRMYH